MRGSWLAGAFVVGCAQPPADLPAPRLDAPVLVHAPPEGPLAPGDSVTLEVTATDPDGVREVAVHHRAGAGSFLKVPMDGDGSDRYAVTLDGLRPPGLEYWFRAFDASDWSVGAELPEGGAADPFVLAVLTRGVVAPWSEGFDDAASTLDLYTLGFSEAALADRGQEWALSELRSHSPPWSARHRRGPAGGWHDDWLISPVLDLSGLSSVEITWQEHGVDTHRATHSLWVSTGSIDPADGDFVLAAELSPPPEDAWGRSALVDLTAWAGSPRVAVAWRYEGSDADEWYLDDIRVAALGPDLHLVSLVQGPLAPGETGELTLSFDNRGAPLANPATLLAETALGPFFDEVLATLDEVEVPLPVPADMPADSLLPLWFTAEADGRLFSFTEHVLVGEPVVATVGLVLDQPGFVQVVVGTDGVEVPVVTAILAARRHALQVDLYDVADHLPPGPGPARWFVRIDSATSGTLTDFAIAHRGEVHTASHTGAFQSGVRTFWLPSMPAPMLTWSEVVPALSPGATGRWELVVHNRGGPTDGPTSLILEPDPRLTLDGVVALGDDLPAGAVIHHVTPVTVADSARDSRPLPVTVTVADAWESWSVEARLPVPWPVLRITGVTVDGDGLLDPGETATVTVTVTNTGLRNLPEVDCALDRAAGSATLEGLEAGEAAALAFVVTLDAGATPGDEIAITLTCGEWTATTGLFVSEPQYAWLTPGEDAHDDAIGGYGFDILYGRWRIVGDRLHLELVSSVPYDPATVMIEGWGNSPGARWSLYQFTLAGGVATLRGYDLGAWWVLQAPTVAWVDDHTLRLDLSLDALELDEPRLSFGLAAGFCGGAAYYCDHYPDGWGDPYGGGFVMGAWVTLSW